MEETKSKFSCCDDKFFSILYLDIRRFQKTDILVKILATLSFNFKFIYVSKTWCSSQHNNSDLYNSSNYSSIHTNKKLLQNQQWFRNFVHNSLTCSVRKDCVSAKGCVHYIFTSLFCMSKERTCETRKNLFYFTSKALSVLETIKFQISRYLKVMTSSNT